MNASATVKSFFCEVHPTAHLSISDPAGNAAIIKYIEGTTSNRHSAKKIVWADLSQIAFLPGSGIRSLRIEGNGKIIGHVNNAFKRRKALFPGTTATNAVLLQSPNNVTNITSAVRIT